MKEELHPGGEAVAGCGIGREEGGCWWCGSVVLEKVDLVGGGFDDIPTHDGHHPWEDEVVGFDEASAEGDGFACSEGGRQECIGGGDGHEVVIVAGEVDAEKIEGPIVEVEVSADAIEGFSRGDDGWGYAVGEHAAGALDGASVEVERSEFEVGVVAWSGGACGLDAFAAGAITFEVEAVGETSPEVFEVGVGGEGDTILGADVGWCRCGS